MSRVGAINLFSPAEKAVIAKSKPGMSPPESMKRNVFSLIVLGSAFAVAAHAMPAEIEITAESPDHKFGAAPLLTP